MKETLRNLFRQKFDYSGYRKVILQNLLHAQELMREPEFLEETNDGDRIYGLGYLRDADGKEIGLYYTNVTKGDVRHKRVGFRKMMKKYTDFGVDAAITVFADKEHWRLSYMCDLKGGVTAAKRFSYIMGDGGMYVTPVNRLSELAVKRIKLEDIHDAFSVEALSDEFFKAYHDHYDIIVAALARQGKTGAIYHDYVKKMMGRIVFLHFLQKKGWLNGNPTFLRDLFFFSPHKDDFLDQVLEPLFFGIFNTEKEQREKLFASEHWDKNLLKEWESMPYLNGGLFERDEIDKMNIKLPASLFDNLFNFLASYNFTVDENDPDDAEIGVDPEMLGKIFESLLEDNKAKGAFYTPKEIVRYMCKESLIAHLSSKLPDVADGVVRTFVESHEMQPELEQHRETLSQALRYIKICDPAIGSGAFPMGLLNELWRCREALGTTESRVALKKEIIENNIYGVDIEKGAIDIARLRFWLSIVVDSEEPEALPNFDYKFMQGNSLIESYQGCDLSRIAGRLRGGQSKSMQLVLGLDSHTSRQNLQRLLREYFSITDHQKKTGMRQAINDEVKTLIRESLGGTTANLVKLNALDPSANQDFFLWHTWFKEIFDRGGFDIVIGNPPYVGEKGHKELFKKVKITAQLGDYYFGKMDYFYFFFHLALNLLKTRGICSFITTNYYPTALGAKLLRKDFYERANILQFINFNEYRIFESARGQHNLITVLERNVIHNTKCKILNTSKTGFINVQHIHSILEATDDSVVVHYVSQQDIYEGDDHYIRLTKANNNDIQSTILSKMQNCNSVLGEIASINAGIMGGCDFLSKHNLEYASRTYVELNDLRINDGVFVLDFDNSRDAKRFEILKNYSFFYDFYKNSDIKRYFTQLSTSKKIIFSSTKNSENDKAIIKSVLDIYKPILLKIRTINNEKESDWYLLRRGAAHPQIFVGPKIVCPQRSKYNMFGYNEVDWFASADVYYITAPMNEYHIKYLLGLLNSKLYYYWLYNKGKRKGDYLELYQKPLSEIPIKKVSLEKQERIVALVDKIIAIKKNDYLANTSDLEAKIDKLVYELYGLTEEEIAVIE